MAISILEPCDIKVGLKSSEAVQDVSVDVSAVQLRMSPDVMQLLQHLQQVCVVLWCGVSGLSTYVVGTPLEAWHVCMCNGHSLSSCIALSLVNECRTPSCPPPQVVMEPLAVPPADQPLARVTRFACLWSSHGPAEGAGAGPPYATAGAGGVAVIGSDKGITVWRPQPPVGYAAVGDVLAPGVGFVPRVASLVPAMPSSVST